MHDPDRLTVEALALGLRAKQQGLRIEIDRKGKYRAVMASSGVHTKWLTYDQMTKWLDILWENTK